MRLASWNILNDWAVPNNKPQKDRAKEISEVIKNVKQKSNKFVIFLCEVETLDNLRAIAKATNLELVGEAGLSRKRDEYCAFLADPQTAKDARLTRLVAGKEPYAVFELRVDGLTIIGTHLPSAIVFRSVQRLRKVRKIVSLSPDIFLGDLNSPTFFLGRKRFSREGYFEAHANDRPLFPSSHSRRENNPWYTPNLNLDAIYHRDNLVTKEAGYLHSRVSDHPIIWADIEN